MTCRIWKWRENDTYFHHHFYLKNANLTVHYTTGTYFFSRWPELSIQDIVRYVLKLWRAWANRRNQFFFKYFWFSHILVVLDFGIWNQKWRHKDFPGKSDKRIEIVTIIFGRQEHVLENLHSFVLLSLVRFPSWFRLDWENPSNTFLELASNME